MLMQKHVDFQLLTFLTLDTERNPFRVSGIATNDGADDVPPVCLVRSPQRHVHQHFVIGFSFISLTSFTSIHFRLNISFSTLSLTLRKSNYFFADLYIFFSALLSVILHNTFK